MNGRIAFFLPLLATGGLERVIANLARGLLELGFETDIVAASAQGGFADLMPERARLFDLRTQHVALSLPRLIGYLRRERPVVLMAGAEHACAIAILATKIARAGNRMVVSQHTEFSRAGEFAFGIRGQIALWLAKETFPLADGFVGVSQSVARDLERSFGFPHNSVHAIYNPVITPEIYDRAKEPVNHPWFCGGCPPVILSAGRLVPSKDFPTLFRAFATLPRKDVRLLVLGEGFDRPPLENLVRKLGLTGRVDLPGNVANPYKYMARAAVFVLSSAWEGLSNVLVEALAVGVPVVSTDAPSGPAEVLGFGKYGRLVPVGDAGALSQAIADALREGRRPVPPEALARFDYIHVARQYSEVLSLAANQ